jgi:hypothetical protein
MQPRPRLQMSTRSAMLCFRGGRRKCHLSQRGERSCRWIGKGVVRLSRGCRHQSSRTAQPEWTLAGPNAKHKETRARQPDSQTA